MSESSILNVTLIGAGGCGCNIVDKYQEHTSPRNGVSYRKFDTSHRGISSVQVLGNGKGSGGDQSTNADALAKEIPALSDEEIGVSDVNIVLFSMNGGSGSVMGPEFVSNIIKTRHKKVILVMVYDLSSKQDADNTISTLAKTVKTVSEAGVGVEYLLFSNADGESVVNQSIFTRLDAIIDLLNTPVTEIDSVDRMNFLVSRPVGMYMLTAARTTDSGSLSLTMLKGERSGIVSMGADIVANSYLVLGVTGLDGNIEYPTVKLSPQFGKKGVQVNGTYKVAGATFMSISPLQQLKKDAEALRDQFKTTTTNAEFNNFANFAL